MKHYLKYKWKNTSGVLEIERYSVSYLDLSSDRPMLYKKPNDEISPIILCGKSTLFIVEKQHVEILKANTSCLIGEIEITLQPPDYILLPLYEKYKPLVLNFLKAKKNRPVIFGSLAALILLFTVNHYLLQNNKQSGFERSINETLPDLSGGDLVEMRIKLANQAFQEKKYDLALDLVDKVLSINPTNPEAISLKEKALQNLNTNQVAEQQELKKDIHIKKLLDTATELAAKKDYEGALFQLEQVLAENSENADAKRLYASIQDSLKVSEDEMQKKQALKGQIVSDSQNLWKEGENLLLEENYSLAWKKLSQALNLLDENNAEAFFKSDLKMSLGKAETELYNQTQPLAEQAKNLQNEGDRQTGNKKISSYKNALSLYLNVKEKFDKYPSLQNEISLVVKKLNESLKPLFTEAQVTQDLEGCCEAKPHYKEIMQYAGFDIVPYYVKAKQAVDTCVCR